MKKLLVFAFLAAAFLPAKAQHIEAGVHGGYGTTWMFNNNVSDQGDNVDQATSFGTTFGIYGGYFFPSRFGIVLEVDYAAVRQKYKTEIQPLGNLDAVDKLSYLEIPLLVRKYTKSGFYFEVGPKFSFLLGAEESLELTPALPFGIPDIDNEAGFKKVVVSAAFGIGGHFPIAKHLYADARLRFAYGFTDATNKFSEDELLAMGGASELGVSSIFTHADQQGNYSYEKTNLATGHVLVGLSYEVPTRTKAPASAR